MKTLLKYTGYFLFYLFVMLLNAYRLADGVFTGIEMLQTALVFINMFAAAYCGVRIQAAWKAYRRRIHG